MKGDKLVRIETWLWYVFISITSIAVIYNIYLRDWRFVITSLLTLSMFVFFTIFSKRDNLLFPLTLKLIFVAITLGAGIFSYFGQIWDAVGNAVITILLFIVPVLLRDTKKIYFPPPFQIVIFIYIFASMFVGEVLHFYYIHPWWDMIVHLSATAFLGYFGFLLAYALNKDKHIHAKLSPFFLATFAFFFSVFVGVLWEIFEFAADSFLGANMQKAKNLQDIYGVFDTRLGVLDTMIDLIVNCIGAFIVAFLGYQLLKRGDTHNPTFWRGKDEFIEDNPEIFE